ncbi:Protein disulfide-isomerase A5 [Triplophysa tibetana]|uniref:Protein disulfide-isomerase A5 n=1 Tax=Triplophysa tibetana TaxID=1572043 RepID=A0A5A9NZC4_9TELE|nr:Protein disulfide-isomerase A5 [Triplophysa tibetana]
MDCACVARRGSGIMASGNRYGRRKRLIEMFLFLSLVTVLSALQAVKVSPLIEKVNDHKDFKKLLRTRTNVLVLYTKSASSGDAHLKLLSDVAQAVKGQGTIAWVNCGDTEGRKLCKKVKVDPSSKTKGVEVLHYKDGTFNTEYNRPATFKSMVAFLKDPSGAPLWEENPEAKDIVHIETEKDFRKLLKKEERPILMMFYAPYDCLFAISSIASVQVLAGMNVHPAEFDGLKQEYSVKGYPTFCYFEKGKFLHNYENYGATSKDITDWLKNPQPPQAKTPEVPWSESGSAVFHLTDDTFDTFLEEHPSALVMFYAPWCGHCKKMKPEYDEAAEFLNKDPDSPGVLAAVDTTIHKSVGERFKISGFPTVKYFEAAEDKYTLPQLRSKDKIIEWLQNPQAPPPPEKSWEETPSGVSHLAAEDFREILKKKKHALIAYAAVDCTKGQNHELCKQEGVEGYPTFNYYNYGKFSEKYNGERGEAGFTGFMKQLRGRDQEKVGKRKEEL